MALQNDPYAGIRNLKFRGVDEVLAAASEDELSPFYVDTDEGRRVDQQRAIAAGFLPNAVPVGGDQWGGENYTWGRPTGQFRGLSPDWDALRPLGFQSKYNQSDDITSQLSEEQRTALGGDRLFKTTLQQPGKHKYDTLEAFYRVNQQGDAELIGTPTESRQQSSSKEFRDTLFKEMLPAAAQFAALAGGLNWLSSSSLGSGLLGSAGSAGSGGIGTLGTLPAVPAPLAPISAAGAVAPITAAEMAPGLMGLSLGSAGGIGTLGTLPSIAAPMAPISAAGAVAPITAAQMAPSLTSLTLPALAAAPAMGGASAGGGSLLSKIPGPVGEFIAGNPKLSQGLFSLLGGALGGGGAFSSGGGGSVAPAGPAKQWTTPIQPAAYTAPQLWNPDTPVSAMSMGAGRFLGGK